MSFKKIIQLEISDNNSVNITDEIEIGQRMRDLTYLGNDRYLLILENIPTIALLETKS